MGFLRPKPQLFLRETGRYKSKLMNELLPETELSNCEGSIIGIRLTSVSYTDVQSLFLQY